MKIEFRNRRQLLCIAATLAATASSHSRSDAFVLSPQHQNSITTRSTALNFGPTPFQDKSSANLNQASTVIQDRIPIEKTDDTILLTDDEFTKALETAKQMDREYGVWSTPSQRAWEVVDRLYATMGGGYE